MMSRVVLYRDVPEIRLIDKQKDKIDLMLQWSDGVVGKFIGYTLNGYLKYEEVDV